jgi:hypothetical protein
MEYGPAPKVDGEARAWLKKHGAFSGISSAVGSSRRTQASGTHAAA